MDVLSLLRSKYEWHRRDIEKQKYTPRTYPEYLRRLGAQVGEDCWIASMNMDVGIEAYLVRIGNHVEIARDVAFITHDGAAWVFRHLVPDLQVYGPIVIEDNCHIGSEAILCPGIRIGRNSVVAARSVVISNVPPGGFVQGVPARVVAPQ
jgi:acetyltransferase-like isoleucine patch superfamily enzyme